MFKLADLMERDTEKLAQLERCVCVITSVTSKLMNSLNTGKGIKMARYVVPTRACLGLIKREMDIADTIACFRYYAGLADKSHGQSNNHFGTDKLVYTLNQPIGVCGQMYAISSLIVA